MTKYARLQNSVVIEIVTAQDGQPITDILHPSLADQCVDCGVDVMQGWTYDGADFHPPVPPVIPLADAQADRIAALTVDCAAAIVGGYMSAALGAPHTYPSLVTDQINMMGSVTASLLPGISETWTTPFWCADGNDAWAYRMHDAAQIQAAGADGKAHVITCQSILADLSASVMAATSTEVVAAVVWPQP